MKKKLAALLIAAFLTTSTFSTAFAAEAGDMTNKAGVTPDSILYPVDKLIEDIRLALSSGDVNKAILLTKYAEERLAETQAMINEGKTTLAEAAADDYSKTMEEANNIIQDASDSGDSNAEGADTENNAVEEGDDAEQTTGEAISVKPSDDGRIEALKDLLEKNIELQKKSIDVLTELLDKLPEKSKQAITAVIVKQIMHTEAVINFVDTKKAYNEGRKEVKTAEKDLRDAQKSGDQNKIAAANKALEDAKEKLTELKEQSDAARYVKKNINSLIQKKLSEINASIGKTGNENEGQQAAADTQISQTEKKEKVNTPGKDKDKEEIKAKEKENKKEIKEKFEKAKEEIKSKVEMAKNQKRAENSKGKK